MRLIMFGTSSPKTIRHVDSPATLAASTKSRFRSDNACPRRMRASNAQSVRPSTRIIPTMPRYCRYEEMTTSSGMVGMTRNTFARKLMPSSTQPPAYAARMPSTVASDIASAAAAAPSMSDVRVPRTTWEKMSLPWSVVPNGWCHDGACFASNRENALGSCVAISGAKSATRIMNVKTTSPPRDFGFESSRRSQPGTGTRPRRAGSAGAKVAAGGSSRTWICDMVLCRPDPRVEDEVEDVHHEVRDDHAQREHEQQRLRQGIVRAERRLLERQAGAGIAEDELDEDEAAHGGRELRCESVQRRQDRVASRISRHDAPVAQSFGMRDRNVVLGDRVDHHRAHVQ